MFPTKVSARQTWRCARPVVGRVSWQSCRRFTPQPNDLARRVFDDPDTWRQYKDKRPGLPFGFHNYTSGSAGMFLNPYLKRPSGLLEFCKESLLRARQLTVSIIADDSAAGLRKYIRNLDRLSDILCRVIDLCEFVRVAHPNKAFVNAAADCHKEMFRFMNELNTSEEMYLKLERVLHDPELSKELSMEEISVGKLLYADFQKAGLGLAGEGKSTYVELSQHIAEVGQQFADEVYEVESAEVLVPKSEVQEGDFTPELEKYIHVTTKGVKIPLYGHVPMEVLQTCPNRDVRRRVWVAMHTAKPIQLKRLTHLVIYRRLLAAQFQHDSFGAYQLNDKMARSPENVRRFLEKLALEIRPEVEEELKVLAKSLNIQTDPIKEIRPWDREYLASKYLSRQKSSCIEDISAYFSLGTVVQGLSDLFKSIYGIELRPAKVQPGEVWEPSVRKFEATSDKDGLVGIIYMDLFYRSNKTLNPAHFTICCSRKIYPEELDENDPFNLKLPTVQTKKHGGDTFQLPVISLVCNFQPEHVHGDHEKCLLSLAQVETLFHEMGHAMHSMLGRTNLHNVSGTRCPTDFVELPSILMEFFAKDERVLLSFARHHKTGEPLPLDILRRHQADHSFLDKSETFSQIKMAYLDQQLHGAIDYNFDPLRCYHDVERHFEAFKDDESSWVAKFGHLYSYGAMYYSYLFDRVIATRIWEHLFAKDPFSRAGGDKFQNQVLRWGGSRDPWELVADVLELPELRRGDAAAMELLSHNGASIDAPAHKVVE
ncbi:hypothetical protein KL933_000434 [Ogataea haglerorum]|uniref:Mitochondrial intermediate peptidase n=1 Tax=Ogataea haglerorum TaxID=1937702 RepID=A0AAN6I2Y5_9ASCO|nr:hypothetical protein KL933_000434 [Ogataea haglerorum]KAG7734764.1 hypothetical protein KL948_000330 [Ogataea haglerorum]KAG7751141.1 hypothetical protein KL912_000274 [Ogataea haglerorum]KAG7791097.1 hypothetical protein KL945_000885 [Ogataea haglerorum]KAG7793635.1 hypothetical protein KL910_000330 [Ogataea haglerorum]